MTDEPMRISMLARGWALAAARQDGAPSLDAGCVLLSPVAQSAGQIQGAARAQA
jgi:hypothetical protein